jgi:hypothetical protein
MNQVEQNVAGLSSETRTARKPVWVESNEQKDAARAMEVLNAQLVAAVIDPYSWKWVMVTLHHTVQAFAVSGLASEPTPIQAPQAGAGRFQWTPAAVDRFAVDRDDYLPALYEEVKRVTKFPSSPAIDQDIDALIECRRLFIQKPPRWWSLQVNELPRTVLNCLRVVEHLGWNPGHIDWYKPSLVDLARTKHIASIKILDALDRQYRS